MAEVREYGASGDTDRSQLTCGFGLSLLGMTAREA